MSYQTEEEQVEKIKELWNRHGIPLLTGVVIALAGVFGWQGWTNYQDTKAANASALYQNMLETVMAGEGEEARARSAELAEQIRSEYAGTRYAQFAGLMQAKMAVEAGDMSGAEEVLREVADEAGDETLQEVARQRLARVLADQERAEEGLELFSGEVNGALLAGREEVRGDLLLGLGRVDEARAAYTAAMEAIEDPRDRPQLQLKLDDLAEEA
ncbi:GTP-binding protein [Halopseudomonas laoshanensis]|uniref:Ancillary SecYEG translocon subunit n=2 Tax=Halopseudomonas TaxID=2901189 RepID=A0A7V7GU67_9GAMM|nr:MULTISPECIES: tetratricopeptide repeat protein [Halopseudomonas]KAA0695009.1 GTP-binding protein [Halopseudomonas laoshanensis]PCD00868.1 GTP-binding protein [Halopseudomonas pelagia]QFY58158.1 GTP-binding protein [Halopseudomonas pelagia]WOD12073.1 tetratricopeptide repeat protein [Pseudomonas sp. NyZ704]